MSLLRPPAPIADGMTVGLLGGSFNPAHEGHIHVSETALQQLGLDAVWWLVSPGNPLKTSRDMAPFEKRVAEARVLAKHPRIFVTDIERRLGTRYTVDTLTALKRRFPRVRFVWLMGSDNLVQIPRWRNWQAIFRLMPVAVTTRPGSALAGRMGTALQRFPAARKAPSARFARETPPAIAILEARRSPVSATELRNTARLARPGAL